MIYCLSVESVIELNRKHTSNNGTVRDLPGLEGSLARPMHTFSGTDLYPSVVQKAAVLLHGLARTQSFVDGNKRTAWLSCLTFLGDKDIRLIDADNVAADFVIALATGELDVLGAAEWILDRIQD